MAERSRAARLDRVRLRRRQLVVAIGCVACLSAVAAASVLALPRTRDAEPVRPITAASLPATDTTPAPAAAAATGPRTRVEVPNVTGRPFLEAEVLLTAAGLVVSSRGATDSADGRPTVVTAQTPPPGTKISQGDHVTLVLASTGSPPARPLVVVIDPGHQARPDTAPEAVGPGASETKERATAGAVGVATKRQEAQVALEVAQRMKTRLEAEGVRVVMTRTANEVDLGNAERAELANRLKADLFVRVHADAAAVPSLRGVSVLYPDGNAWVRPVAAQSRQAARAVLPAMVAATGAKDQGVQPRADIAGFNWCKVPAVLIETGFLSNEEDDRLLANPGYQDKIAKGAVEGILAYFGR